MYKDTQAHVFLIRTAVIMHYVHAHVPRIADRGENESCRHQEVWDMLGSFDGSIECFLNVEL